MDDDTRQRGTGSRAVSGGLAAAAALMVITTIGSRLTGMVRMMVIGHIYGATGEVNAFFQAFAIPDFVYFLIAGGALRTGFVPIFTEYITKGQHEKAWRTFSVTFWTLLLFASLLVGGAMLFAPELTSLVAPGWAKINPQLIGPCGRMMRVLFPAQVFFMLGGLMQGALNAKKHFLWPGVGPIVYNLVIITGALVAPHLMVRLHPGVRPESGIVLVPYFVLVGALLGNVLIQIPPLAKLGARLEARLDVYDEGMVRIFKLALPVIFGLAIGEVNWMIVRILATHFLSGPAILEFSNRLWKLPSGIFAAGVAIAIFPSLSEHYTREDTASYVRDFSFGLRNTLFMMVPAVLALGVLRTQIFRLLFQHGEVGPDTTVAVAHVLLWLTPSMLAMGISYIAARGLYARQRMYKPVTAGLISIVLCRVSAIPLMKYFALPGLAMANTVGDVTNAIILLWLLKSLVGRLDGRRILLAQWRCVPGNLFLFAVCLMLPRFFEAAMGTESLLAKAVEALVPLGVGVAGFVLLASLMHVEELRSAWRLLTRRGRRRTVEQGTEGME